MARMIESGRVVAARDGLVEVQVKPGADMGCSHCGHCSTARDGRMVMCDVADPLGASVGDTVEVELPQGSRLYASALSYGLPVLALLPGYLAGFLLGRAMGSDADAAGSLAAVAAAAGTFAAARSMSMRAFSTERYRPRVRAIISPSGEDTGGSRP